MMVFVIYLAVFLPLVYATARLRTLREARPGYKRFMCLWFGILFLIGFLAAPAAAVGMLLLLGAAGLHTAKELRFRIRQVRYLRGQGPRPAVPGRAG